MRHSSNVRFTAIRLATMFVLLLPVLGHAQTARRDVRQVSISAWVVLATEDFRRELQSAGGATNVADTTVVRTLLESAVRSGDAQLVSQPVLMTQERVPGEFGIDLPLPFERTNGTGNMETLEKQVRLAMVFTPQFATDKDIALSVRVTTQFNEPATTDKAQVLVADARSLKRSMLLPEGRTLVLAGVLNVPESLRLAAVQGKSREMLVLVAPRAVDGSEQP
jgi:type II secretory pathway component GspD/PulD (secretin)